MSLCTFDTALARADKTFTSRVQGVNGADNTFSPANPSNAGKDRDRKPLLPLLMLRLSLYLVLHMHLQVGKGARKVITEPLKQAKAVVQEGGAS